ncbi:MAG: pentapeptide repeat-containing protein [Cyanobacteria bacterium P01_A01_bin.68]
MNAPQQEQLLAPNLVKLYESGVRNFSGKKIWGDLVGKNLSGSDFSNCDFYADKLSNANLSHVNFENTNFPRVNLNYANLEHANLTNVVIRGNYRNSLKGVNLDKANLSYASFVGVDLTKASLKQAIFKETTFWYVNLKDADLTGTNLKNSIFKSIFWLNTQIGNIEDLPEKELLSWQLVNQLIDDENLRDIDLSEINLEGANLEGINLSHVNLKRARLTKINLANANLQGSNLQQAYLFRANLDNADLSNADLSVAHLAGANLTNTNLSNANLTQAKLNNVNLFNANLKNTNLTDASVFHAKLQEANNIPQNIISIYKPISANNPNKILIKEMREAAVGLDYPSEASEPYEIFLWEQEFFEDFRLDKLLELTSTLKLVDLDYFENSISALNINIPKPQNIIDEVNQLSIAFKRLIQPINSYLISIRFYQFETRAINDYSRIMPHIAIAQIQNGYWLAIGTLFENELHQECTKSAKQKIEINNLYEDEINQEIVKILNNNIKFANNLLPDLTVLHSFHWSLANQREVALQNLLIDTKHFTIFDFDDFFALGISDNAEENYKRQTLHDLVTANLEDLRIYRIGACDMDFYLMGQAKNSDWIGIRTDVTWT